MTAPRLTQLDQVVGPAATPAYVPSEHKPGVVHIGVGAFHRAHQAAMTDAALGAKGGDWRIIGVSLRSKEIAENLNDQNGLYTLIERGTQGESSRVIGAIDHVIAADPAATLKALCEPSIRVVTLTVTEKGYGINHSGRTPDTSNPVVSEDLKHPSTPTGVLGLLVCAIAHRRQAGQAPFAVLPCDNLPDNGELVRDCTVAFARAAYDDELADWIAETIAFPSSMVDRITPAATDKTLADACSSTGCSDLAAIESESFTQWVIEENFPSGRPAWEEGGALFVPSVTPYEQMKLTMLNGTHSMLAYSGFLTGHEYVRDVMTNPALTQLVNRHLGAASALLEPLPGVDFDRYSADLIQRFINPSIAHRTYQIAMDGTQKIPPRMFATSLKAMEIGQDIRPFAFATAMWMRFCLGHKDDGTRYDLPDPRAAEITAALENVDRDASAISNALHALPRFIPQSLATDDLWRTQIEEVLTTALSQGCTAAVEDEATRGGAG